MNTDTYKLIDGYYAWLKSKTTWREVNGWNEIITPYLDRHNDYIAIYLRRKGDEWELTDDGETLIDLEHSGCKLDSPRRKALLQTTLNGFGVQLVEGAITVKTKEEKFAMCKHNLVQAMLAVNDLFYLASSSIKSFFFEDVALWMDTAGIRYTSKVKFVGRSGYDHSFDFVVPKSPRQPERIVRVINDPGKTQAQAVIFSWDDTKKERLGDAIAYTILNDNEKPIPDDVSEAFANYGIISIPWSKRDNYREQLAA